MQVINFKQEDDPCEYFFFPGGEPHAKVPTFDVDSVYIRVYDMTWNDYGHLICLLSALAEQLLEVTLAIPYFPGARQDRNPGGNSPLTVDIFAEQLSSHADHIIVVDMHSPAGIEYLAAYFRSRCVTHIATNEIFNLWKDQFSNITHVIAPDKGAQDRASRVAEVLGVPVITCEKVREFETGKITHYEIIADELPPGNYLVVDDICDGGTTFILLAASFVRKVSGGTYLQDTDHTLSLYVTHGIFSKGLDYLMCDYHHIYTTNSRHFPYFDFQENQLTILDIDPLLKGVIDNELHV